MALRIAVIADGESVQRFALNALDATEGCNEVTLFSCSNTRTRKRWLKHCAYYALNLATVRNPLTRFVPIASGNKRIARQIAFNSSYEGVWQVLPEKVIDELRSFDVILKFGIGLLRVPSPDVLPVPILSYHHGDPDCFRGRPAGFWEMREGTSAVGQVVQVIGDKLDAGEIVAFAETKVFPWSYRKTLMEAYRHSPSIINTAIRNAIAGTYVPKSRTGRNCRLPSNWVVIGFTFRTLAHGLKRLLYGMFQEKAWNVSTAARPETLLHGTLPDPGTWATLQIAEGYDFYADPFFTSDPHAILVEAPRSGIGEILKIDESGHHSLIREPGHLSYPSVARIGGREVIVPETASWCEPRVYCGGELLATLRLEAGARISDPTLFEREGRIYLFGNSRELGSGVLDLWISNSLDAEFQRHPASPIRISPEGSRMGGNILALEGRLFRLGQDLSGDYGNGLIIFEINELTPESYCERRVAEIRFTDRKGPHTLNLRGDEIVFDWYRDRVSPLAGFRRLRSALQRRRPHATQ